MKNKKENKTIKTLLTIILVMSLTLLASCGGSEGGGSEGEGGANESGTQGAGDEASETGEESIEGAERIIATLSDFETSDMSGYEGLKGYEGPLPFVDVTVKDVHELLEDKATFVLFISFPDCPWCNAVIRQFTEVSAEVEAAGGTAGAAASRIANINTRKNPAWANNLEIDDYDIFIEDFGEYLEYDDQGIKHLYVPHIFFVKDGSIVYEHQGAIPAMGSDPYMVLTAEQNEELKDIFREGFSRLN